MAAKVFFDKDDDLIDICRDNVFKAVFTRDTPVSQGALSKLVSALIGREITIIAINANEPPIDNLRDRQIRYDINCRAVDGELVNVEMSLNPEPFEPVRLEFYAGKLFTGQDIRGSNRSFNDLQMAYQIAILAKESFFHDELFYHAFEYYDPVRQMPLGGRSRIITLELSKLEKVVVKPIEEMDKHEHWAVYFRYLTDKSKREKINEIIEQEEGIAMASEALFNISKDEIEQAWRLSEYKYELDTQSIRVNAMRQGLKEGREEGRQEIIDLLRSGKSPEEILKIVET